MATPNVAVIARLVLKEMKKDQREYNRILKSIAKDTAKMASGVTKATGGMTKSFDEFIDKSKAMANVFNLLSSQVSRGIFEGLGIQFQNLSKDAQVNIEKFDELIRQGTKFDEAFRQATTTAEDFAAAQKRIKDADKEWLATLGQVTTAIAGVTGVLRIAQREFGEAIETYSDLAEETRRITLQTGLAAEEASIWAKTAELQGVSARSLAAGFAQVSRNLTNVQLRLAAGQEDNTNFTKTIRALGIEVRNSEGNFKGTSEIITEVNEKIRELGPGWQAAGVTQNIYGRGAASLLPIILDQSVSIEEVTGLMEDMGAVMTDLDKESFDRLREANARLNIANQSVSNTISREYIPILIDLKNAWASVLEVINRTDQVARAASAGFKALLNPATAFVREFNETAKEVWQEDTPQFIQATLGPLRAFRLTLKRISEEGLEFTSVAEAYQEELDKLKGVTEEVADAESELTDERREAIDALFAEVPATEELNDALEDQQKIVDKLADAWNDYQNRIADVNRRFDDQLEDQGIRESRERIKRNLELSFKLEDIYIKRERRIRDIAIDTASKQRDVQRDLNRKLEDFERDAARAREKIAVKHRENLIKIENTFNDTIQEAARTNDTVAVVRAIRNRNRQQRDENRRFSVEQQELEKDLAIKRDKIREDAKRREDEEKQRADERRARIEQQFKDEIDDLIRKNQRELVLSRNKDRERRQDIERNRSQALRDAEIFYRREEDELRQHLAELDSIVRSGITTTVQTISVAVDTGIQNIATVISAAMTRASTEFIGGGLLGRLPRSPTEFIGGGLGRPTTGQPIDDWLRRQTPGGYRAHGGLDVVNKPTTFVAGEAGAEIAAFIPLSQSRNINHNFGKLPIDFQGLPGGMDNSQVETIVYGAMMELARTLSGARR